MNMKICVNAVMALVLLLGSFSVAAAEIHDAAALGDLKQGKGVFLVDIAEPGKLAFYLKAIEGTYQGMKAQGVTPDFILVYIGPSVKYLSTKPDEDLVFEHHDALQSIAESVAALDELGVRQEICAVATRAFAIDDEALLPALTLVGDGFISLIGWQSQGYHLVPVF
ncbi:MAG TPA: DsrE family protein [Gammaproteobacteria bacterium]|nr:DsrE family protein [Gammaproteobacteria bacterium]